MIKGRQPGDNITIMNTLFWKVIDNGNKFHDYLSLVYKDCDTGLKYVEELTDPDYEYYMVDPDHRVDYNRLFIPEEQAIPITVPYKDIEKDIAKRTGLKDYFYDVNIHVLFYLLLKSPFECFVSHNMQGTTA